MSTTIESLELEIISNSRRAESGLDALTQSLTKLRNATKGGLGLKAVAKQIQSVNNAMTGVESGSIVKLNGLAKAIQLLGGVKVSSTIGTQITSISTALKTMDIGNGAIKIQELVTALQPLSTMPKQNISSFFNQLKKIPEVLKGLNDADMDAFKTKIQEVATAVKPLADEMNKVAAGFSAFPTKIQKLITSTNKLSTSNKNASLSYLNLYSRLKMIIAPLKQVVNAIATSITKSNNYIENMNLFEVSMGEYASEAKTYAEIVSDAMGIDTSDWVRAQGVFMTIATGFGVAGDRAAKMSKNLTQLGYDISSFYNISVEDAMTKLKSGLAGELEPLRAIGYDLSQAKLEATALALGIDKSVSSMTQAEKAQLRYYAIMTQVTAAQGDMARTLDDPANQLRVLKAEVNMAARELGNMFIPVLNAILPPVIAATKVIRILASSIAGLFGNKAPDLSESTIEVVENTDAVQENLQGAQEEAKKLKSYMLGFDELNVINPNEGATDDVSGEFDFELPEYDFMEGLVDSKVSTIVEEMKEWLGITEDITSWSDLLTTNFGNILAAVGLITVGIAAWKISKLIPDLKTATKLFSTLGRSLKIMGATMGIVAVAAVAVESVSWVIQNTEDTITKVGAILSGASLAVGAILAFTGINIPLGIALMAVGAISMASIIAMNTTKLSDEVKGVLAVIETAVSLALLGVGAILAFSGTNIPLGIALMAGGAVTMASAVLPNWDKLSQDVQDVITLITGIVGAGLLVIGTIFAFSGANIPLGIGLMLAGAVSLGTAIALNWNGLSDEMEVTVGKIAAILGGALLVVGGILAFSGANLPLGIALMAIGAASLGSAIALNWEAISTALQGPVGGVTAIVSGALLALGAILAFSGAGIPLGIALMVAGAAGLATAAALNWDSIVTAMQGPVGKIMAIAGAAALVIGMILLFTGVGIPLGLGLILGGAAALGSAIAFNWDAIVDAIKKVWKKITAFWDENIAPVFTAKWWTDLGKIVINGLIAGIEGGINGIIWAFESLINLVVNGLNKISFDIPDWLGGGTFGINIPTVSFNRVSIPRFEEGGFPEQGQMFIAREAGAEMVGSIGRRTAVVNNEQIVESISVGVAEANGEQNALLREQNSLLRALLEKDSGVYLDGRSLSDSVDKYKREQGRVLITGGAL